MFFYTEVHDGTPANCPTYYRKRRVIDISDTVGKAKYALLLTAQTAGRTVKVFGTGDCGVYSDSETADIVGYTVDYSKHP